MAAPQRPSLRIRVEHAARMQHPAALIVRRRGWFVTVSVCDSTMSPLRAGCFGSEQTGVAMSSYARYCQSQAAECVRRARMASSPEVVNHYRNLGLQWVALAQKERAGLQSWLGARPKDIPPVSRGRLTALPKRGVTPGAQVVR
jgi:hypothetical protein